AAGAGRAPWPDRGEPASPAVPVDVLALPGRGVDRGVHLRLPDRRTAMSETAVDHGHDAIPGGMHFSLRGYATGFLLSVVLTAIPFWLVMRGVLPDPTVTAVAILAFAAVQIVVHMVFFLHMSPKSEGGW